MVYILYGCGGYMSMIIKWLWWLNAAIIAMFHIIAKYSQIQLLLA